MNMYSYLHWPLHLKHHPEGRDLHITLKYFSKLMMPIDLVRSILSNQRTNITDYIGDFNFVPVSWVGHDDRIYHVLKLELAPMIMIEAHVAFAMFENSFPQYQPHITVDESFWRECVEMHRAKMKKYPDGQKVFLTGAELIDYMGPLTLTSRFKSKNQDWREDLIV